MIEWGLVLIQKSKHIAKQRNSRLLKGLVVRGLIIIINILLKAKKVIFWLFHHFFKIFNWVVIYRPLVWLYTSFLKVRRRLINHYQRNLWLAAGTIISIAVAITISNWQESDRLVAAEDLVRGTWLSQMVGDEFNQLNDIVIDDRTNQEYNFNRENVLISKLSVTGVTTPGTTGLVGMATDRWIYSLGIANLPKAIEQSNLSAAVGSRGITYYTVKIGDTLSGLSKAFGVSLNTIAWQNGLSAKTVIRPGDKLTILPVSGVLHKVKSGDSLSKIAKLYKADANAIANYNNLKNDRVVIGQSLIIPGGQQPVTVASQVSQTISKNLAPKVQQVFSNVKKTVKNNIGSGAMTWPTSGHRITQYYSLRHNGLDIANKVGTPIYAADGGRIEIAAGGWNGGYGNTIVVNHGKLKTRYGHLSRLYVKVGQTVVKGQVIGEMGSTGRSTGPHLHFEVMSGKVRYNPLNYIR
ncbi:MAG TPA: peptidoglycan DD-metalloendopeptidase family protein [bacterium]|nr:peptidoglycan DD-metalloendopeptidase family protein [bacterium]